jgi:peptidoglycan/LPS O-acetylase OafA/YrhL
VQRLGYRPALDGLRGVAILLVFGKHAFDWPEEGGLGVDLFFVLSGFLITSLLLEERSRRGRVSLRQFYRRRSLRLFPALFAMLLAYLAVKAAEGDLVTTLRPLAVAVSYTANLALANGSTMPGELRHLWSLAQEEQFYLLWPPVLLLAIRYRPRWLVQLTIVAIVIVAFERARLAGGGASLDRVYFAPDTHAEPLLVGCLFGIWQINGLPPLLARSDIRRRLALAAAVLYVTATLVFHDMWLALYGTPLFTLLAGLAAIIVLSAARDEAGIARLLQVRPLVSLGRISYGLYLWHVPVLAAFGAAALAGGALRSLAAVAVSIAIALASHRFVERPFLRRKYAPEYSHGSGVLAPTAPAGAQ